MSTPEHQLEKQLIEKLTSLKYEYRPDIRDRFSLEKNFREKFESLNRVHLTEGEFQRIPEEIITPDVFAAARTLRERNGFIRDDGTPLNYTLVNIRDWCKNTFEVVNQLRINTDSSHHRYDVILLINGVPVVQIELKTLGISPRRAMEQIVEYKNDPGNGCTKTLLSFLQLFGFTSTPIFEENATAQKIEDRQASMKTTEDLFQKKLHAYTITHAIEDGNVLRFHVDYFKPEGKNLPKPGEALTKRAIIEAILAKHDAATGGRRFNALLATASINDAIEYHGLFSVVHHERQTADLSMDNTDTIEQVLPREELLGFRGAYLETAQRLRAQRGKGDDKSVPDADRLDFELVLFASAVIDYDYIMALIARYSQQPPGKQKMSREQLVGLIQSDAKLMNEREDIAAYIATLKAGEALSETAVREGYTRFKTEKDTKELADIAGKHRLAVTALQGFVDGILSRMIFDGEQLSDLMAPLELSWKARTQAELALMEELLPLLIKRAEGREISGLSAYEQ